MGAFGAITTLILLALNIIGALRLERMLGSGFEFALLAVVLILIFGLISTLGIGMNTKWGWPLSLIVYSGVLAYVLGTILKAGSGITVWLTTIVATFGYLISAVAMETSQPLPAPAPAPTTPMPAAPTVKRTTKRTKKKAKQKR